MEWGYRSGWSGGIGVGGGDTAHHQRQQNAAAHELSGRVSGASAGRGRARSCGFRPTAASSPCSDRPDTSHYIHRTTYIALHTSHYIHRHYIHRTIYIGTTSRLLSPVDLASAIALTTSHSASRAAGSTVCARVTLSDVPIGVPLALCHIHIKIKTQCVAEGELRITVNSLVRSSWYSLGVTCFGLGIRSFVKFPDRLGASVSLRTIATISSASRFRGSCVRFRGLLALEEVLLPCSSDTASVAPKDW